MGFSAGVPLMFLLYLERRNQTQVPNKEDEGGISKSTRGGGCAWL